MSKKKPRSRKKLPASWPTEEEILIVLERVANRVSHKFVCGSHDLEDIKQEARQLGLEALSKYDPEIGPLENFIVRHVQHRLKNFKRDNFCRLEPPCMSCPLYDPGLKKSQSGCAKYENKLSCDLYFKWESKMQSRVHLSDKSVGAGEFQVVQDETLATAYGSELYEKISRVMPMSLMADFKRMLEGLTVPAATRIKIQEIVGKIING